MDGQTGAVIAILFLAGMYLTVMAWRGWKRLRAGGCSSSCGCKVMKDEEKSPTYVQGTELTARLRSRSQQPAVPDPSVTR